MIAHGFLSIQSEFAKNKNGAMSKRCTLNKSKLPNRQTQERQR